MINPPLYLKIICTLLLSFIAVLLYALNQKSKARFYCMIAMLLCTVGDIFMTNVLKVPNETIATAVGAASFMAGHLFYAYMFYFLSKRDKKPLNKVGIIVGLVVGLVPIIVMDTLGFILVEKPEVLFLIAVPVYVIVITVHIAANFGYSLNLKSYKTVILMFAVVLFYVTDIWIFLYMFKLAPKSLQDCVWHFYPLAQLLIILFSCELPSFKKNNSK